MRKKGLDEMPVKRREIVVKGEGARILSCIQKRSLPLSDGCRMGGGEERRRVYSSSGVLYNSSSFFLSLASTNSAATTSTPRSRGLSLDSTRFQPPSPPPSSSSPLPLPPGGRESTGIVSATMGLIRHWE